MEQSPHILIIDDQADIRDLLSRFLQQHGYRCSVGCDGLEMRRILKTADIDLVVLDVMLPGDDGVKLCLELRQNSRMPVIMLTAMGEDTDRIVGLEVGADDYMAKPFNPRELVARIKSVLRRTQDLDIDKVPVSPNSAFRFDRWRLDTQLREITDSQGIVVSLSTAEFNLLMAFLENSQRILSRDRLLDLARGRAGQEVFDRSIDTLVSRLRKKLEANPKKPILIQTVWGGGYKFTQAAIPC